MFFFSNMIFTDKIKLAINFKTFFAECVSSRILITTNAYKLDVNNSDVKRVMQWLLLSIMSKLY